MMEFEVQFNERALDSLVDVDSFDEPVSCKNRERYSTVRLLDTIKICA